MIDGGKMALIRMSGVWYVCGCVSVCARGAQGGGVLKKVINTCVFKKKVVPLRLNM